MDLCYVDIIMRASKSLRRTKFFRRCNTTKLPVEGGVVQENLNAKVLLQKAVSQDGHRGEADVVHRQIGCIIQGLGRMGAGGRIEGGKEETERWDDWGLI